MSQVAQKGVEPLAMDPYEIGWYIESADEEIYGPVSRKALRRFLEDKTITPNTLVRHCTQPEARPAADQPVIMDQLHLEAKGSALGDRLAEAWPRKKRDRQALAEDSLPCAWHKRPAVLVCVRCHAPYCNSAGPNPFASSSSCAAAARRSMYNRRIVALFVDTGILFYVPFIVAVVTLAVLGAGQSQAQLVINIVQLVCLCPLFRSRLGLSRRRDRQAIDRFAGRAVEGRKDAAHLWPGSRALAESVYSLFQPVSMQSVPYRDPLLRRVRRPLGRYTSDRHASESSPRTGKRSRGG